MLEKHPREKRLTSRVNQLIPVDIYYNGQFIATKHSRNFGFGGMLIDTTDLGLSIYSLIELEISIPNNSQSRIRISAMVKRINDSSMAVAFESINQANKNLLKELISLHQAV